MMNKAICLLACILALGACSQETNDQTAQADNGFDVLCSQFVALTQADNYSELNSEDRGAKLENMLSTELEPNSDAYVAWSAIRNASPAQRYELYQQAAASTGYDDWQCPVLEEHGHEVGSRHE